MEGLAASLRLPDTPIAGRANGSSEGQGVARNIGDGVFLRLMALPKGRTLLAGALKLIYPVVSACPCGAVMLRRHAPPYRHIVLHLYRPSAQLHIQVMFAS